MLCAMTDLSTADEHHRSHRTGWLRAAVLGANDGLLSTASLLIGVAAGSAERSVLVLTGVAALAAGSLSMAAGEYSSVSSQRDAEMADLDKERRALADDPHTELRELAAIYERKGLTPELSLQVAEALHDDDPFRAHSRDELGLDPDALTSPVQASVTSAGSFALGAAIPVLTMALCPAGVRSPVTVVITLLALALLGSVSAVLGGAKPVRSAMRLLALGALSMVATTIIGRLVGTAV
jgi:vacuolar iron transporter family protein